MKMKSLIAFAACPVLGLVADMADPQVSNVKVAQDSVTRRVTVTYDIDEPAIITMDVLTNGVSIGDANIHYVSGDCNKLVKEGQGRTLYWNPEKSWPGQKFTSPVVTVKLTAWATNAPPDYMVVDLAASSSVSFYTSEAALPGGLLKNEAYRRTKLVMRRIHQPASGKWIMGVSAEPGKYQYGAHDNAHEVTLTRDYYIGVFPVTQDQFRSIGGDYLSSFKFQDPATRGMRPATAVYQILRRCNLAWKENGGPECDWPNDPYPTSFIGLIRARTGVAFDLPGEMEWEYACRAGHGQGYWGDGSPIALDILETKVDANLDKLARYGLATVSDEDAQTADLSVGTSMVGSKEPKDWGLYDLCGTVWEWCTDWFNADISSLNGAVNVDPNDSQKLLSNGEAGKKRTKRGGSYDSEARWCRPSWRTDSSAGEPTIGFRLWAPAEIK